MSFQLLLAKTEANYGVDAVAAALNSVWAENVQFKEMGERVVLNPAKPSTTANPGVITAIHSEVSFDVLLSASGTAGVAPAWGSLITSCGYVEDIEVGASVTYTPMADASTAPSQTMVWRDSGRLHKALGARGKVGLKVMEKQPPRLSFMFRALLVPLAAGAALVPADADFSEWPEVLPVAQGRTTFSLGGVPLTLRELSADSADNVKFIDLPGQKGVYLKGDRGMTGKIKAHMPPVGTYNPEAKWITGAKEVFGLTHNTAAGTVVTVNGRAQLDAPTFSRADEFDAFDSSIFLVGSDLATNDDFSIVLT